MKRNFGELQFKSVGIPTPQSRPSSMIPIRDSEHGSACSDLETEQHPERLSGLLNHFVESTDGKQNVAFADLIDSLDSRATGPMLLLPAVIAISPIGMIPGASAVTGSLIALIAIQMFLFSGRPWIPRRLREFEFSRERLKSSVDWMQPWIQRLESVIQKRFEFLATGAGIYPVAGVCLLLALTFLPLALIPFGVLLPGATVALFALGLTARDGLLVAFGYVLTLGTAMLLWQAWA